ncbi:MAG: hypothetical protein RI560_07865 [Natronomonas sp.]|uniref:hypothetical protein n=1 Tax=Natronomonas sp. TaxID=2184060 RepID=UPI0028706498|nr:hypothetical protein [Natronomonas sp.]MDR9381572.1 hypothetical protein [Natronomonas sp.]MDR9432066.1 hypothetical protein [Natronomonas sp.]
MSEAEQQRDLEARVEELEGNLRYLNDEMENWRASVYQPTKESAAAERDDARQERAELQAAVDALYQCVQDLERKLDSVVGVDDATDSNPTKRANDLRLALVRDAEQRSDDHAGHSQMWWQEVQQFFRQTGHGNVSKPDCYKAMRWAAGAEKAPERMQPGNGFKMTTKTNPKGQEVQAVAVDVEETETAELPSYADSAVESPSSDPTTGVTVEEAEKLVN